MQTTPIREQVLALIREERANQIELYGDNADLEMGFGGNVSDHPWLLPFSDASGDRVEKAFRHEYELYEKVQGNPTWMHLIREEVAELFSAKLRSDIILEAVQVAALCVSLVETIAQEQEATP